MPLTGPGSGDRDGRRVVISVSTIEDRARAGHQHLDLPPGALVTPAARDRARELGLDLRNGTTLHQTNRPALKPAADAPVRTSPKLGTPSTTNEPSTESPPHVLYERSGHLARITLNRPEVLNAMDPRAYHEAWEAFKEVRDNPDVWVAIVTGAGDRAFCVGGDLKGYSKKPVESWHDDFWGQNPLFEMNDGLGQIKKPLIAAVNGYCVGWGLMLLLHTDIRVATPSAKFGYPEIRRGTMGGGGGTLRLPRQIPHAIAMHLLLTGEMIDVDDAHRAGLINTIVPFVDLMPTAERYAAAIMESSPLATQVVKSMVLRGLDLPIPIGQHVEGLYGRIYRDTEDFGEGLRSWVEKRPPEWKGR